MVHFVCLDVSRADLVDLLLSEGVVCFVRLKVHRRVDCSLDIVHCVVQVNLGVVDANIGVPHPSKLDLVLEF